MGKRLRIEGIGVVNATPLTADDRLNEAEYRRHVRWMLDAGVGFLQPVAATGQALQTTEAEWQRILEVTVEEAKGRALVTAYTGRAGTAETIRLTRRAAEIGCDAAYIIQPYFSRPDAEGLYLHYRAVARAVPEFPLVIYNNPERAGVSIPIEVLERLVAECENIVGLKQSDLSQFADCVHRLGERITVWPKAEKEILFGLTLGAPGVLTFAGNVVPRELGEIVAAFGRGDLEKAREIYLRLLPLFTLIHVEPVPAAIKGMLNRMGWDFGPCRLPIHEVSAESARSIDATLRKLDLI